MRRHKNVLEKGHHEITAMDPHDKEVVTRLAAGREIIHNDGKTTYAVHSSTPDKAPRILEDGFVFKSKYNQADEPHLGHTAVMMAGPKEPAAVERNVYNLAYRYGRNGIKFVFEFDVPNPGTSLNRDAFSGTALNHADGVNIQRIGTEGEDGIYRIPPERIKGYFDLESGEFVANERFVPPASQQAPQAPVAPAA